MGGGHGIIMVLGIDNVSAEMVIKREHILNYSFSKREGGEEDTKREKFHTSTPSIQKEQASVVITPPMETISVEVMLRWRLSRSFRRPRHFLFIQKQ